LNSTRFPTAERKHIADQLQDLYTADADPGIHGSASWTLRQWSITPPKLPAGKHIVTNEQANSGARRWYINSQGQTMVVFPKSAKDKDRQTESFAISTHEVTIAEFLKFRKGHELNSKFTLTEDFPAHNVDWYLAAEYCNWLSEQEGLPEEQWVYEQNKDNQGAMASKKNFRELGGCRLPTHAEWEHACRAGASGSYGFGEPTSLLGRYSHFFSRRQSGAVESLLPNEAGLFDMHGNLSEWTHDAEVPYDAKSAMGRRIMRGGNFLSGPSRVQSNAGLIVSPRTAGITVGFRVARTRR
jgi:formylglycine-generating enzyme required for sulfatase activity